MGYFQSRNYRITYAKLNFDGLFSYTFTCYIASMISEHTVMYVALHSANKCAHLDTTSAVTWLGMITWLR